MPVCIRCGEWAKYLIPVLMDDDFDEGVGVYKHTYVCRRCFSSKEIDEE